jgi:hypothetical protein
MSLFEFLFASRQASLSPRPPHATVTRPRHKKKRKLVGDLTRRAARKRFRSLESLENRLLLAIDVGDAFALEGNPTQVSGVLSGNFETAVYRFATDTPGRRVQFAPHDTPSPSAIWTLYGPSDQFVGGSVSMDREIEAWLPVAGDYSLVISAYGLSEPLHYAFTVTDTSEFVTTPSGLGTTLSGTLPIGGNASHSFVASAGQPIYLDGLDSDYLAKSVSIIDPTGTSLLENLSTAGDSGIHTLPLSGSYSVHIQDVHEHGGPYHFRILDPLSHPFITLDEPIVGQSESARASNIYQFQATAGQRLHFHVESGEWSPLSVQILDPSYESVAGNWFHDFETGLLPLTGTYTLLIAGISDEPAEFSFQLREAQLEGHGLSWNEELAGEIAGPGDIVEYVFSATAGQRVLYDALFTEGDVWSHAVTAELIGPDGVAVMQQGPAHQDSRPFTLAQTGDYRLQLRSHQGRTGPFSFRLVDLSELPSSPLGSTISGQLNTEWETAVFAFDATAGQRLHFHPLANPWTSHWTLYGPRDEYLGGHWFEDLGTDFLTADGTYILVFEPGSEEVMDYEFLATDALLHSQPLVVGETITGSVSQPGDIQEFTFQGIAGQQLLYDALHNDELGFHSLHARLIGPSGVRYGILGAADGGPADGDFWPFVLPQSGMYRLRIQSHQGGTGPFSFRLLDLAEQPALPLEEVMSVQIPRFEKMVWNVTANSGEQLDFEVLSSENPPSQWHLYGPHGTFIGGDLVVGWTTSKLFHSGTYTLVVSNNTTAGTHLNFRANRILDVVDDVPPGESIPLELGQVAAGAITEPEQVVEYQFTGTAGQRLLYDALYKDEQAAWWEPAVHVRFVAPSGDVMQFAFRGDDDTGPFTLTESGTYRLQMYSSEGGTGDFAFRLLDLSFQEMIVPEEPVMANLETPYRSAVYVLDLSAGEYIQLDLLSDVDNAIRFNLYGPQNEHYADGGLTDWQYGPILYSGTHVLVVWSLSPESSTHEFRILNSVPHRTSAAIGELVWDNDVGLGETREHQFWAEAGQHLLYDPLGSKYADFPSWGNPGIWMELVRPSGDVVVLSQPAGVDSVPFHIGETGEYVLLFKSHARGTGNMPFRLVDLTEQPFLTWDTQVTGSRSEGRESAIYHLELEAGQSYYLEPLETSSDMIQWTLHGPGNEHIAGSWFDDIKLGAVPWEGTYTLILSTIADEPYDFTFRLLNSVTEQHALPLNTAVTGEIQRPGDAVEYIFAGIAGQRLLYDSLFDVHQAQQSPTARVQLIGPTGKVIGNEWHVGSDGSPFRLAEDGIYRLRISGHMRETGPFAFQLISISDSPAIDIETTVAEFVVTRSSSEEWASVDFTTVAGTATSGVDFQPVRPGAGRLTFAPGEESKTIRIPIVRDLEIESDETFFVVLSNPTNDLIGRGQGMGTILNDDGPGNENPDLVLELAISAPRDGFGGVAGQPRRFLLQAADQAPSEQFLPLTYTIDWGDGSPVQIVQGGVELELEHIFALPGSFPISASVADPLGQQSSAAQQLVMISVVEVQDGTVAVGGTTGADTFILTPSADMASLQVRRNGVNLGLQPLEPETTVAIFGQGGGDSVTLLGTANADVVQVEHQRVVLNGLVVTSHDVSSWRVNSLGGNDEFVVLGTFPIILDGGSGTDRIIGPEQENTWRLTTRGAGELNSVIQFLAMERILGGAHDDTFQLVGMGGITGILDGGAGENSIDYSQADRLVTFNLSTSKATGTGGIAHISHLTGSPQASTLVGPGTDNVWELTGERAGTLNGVFTFVGIDNLTGGSAGDHFQFGEAANGFGVLSGGTGTNVIDYSLLTHSVLVDLGLLEASGMATFKGISSWVGSGSSENVLVGPNTTTTWQLSAVNEGLVGKTAFANFHGLHAGTGRNTFRVNSDFIRLDGMLFGNHSDTTLVGPNVDNVWELTGDRAGTLNGVLAFVGIDNLTGGSAGDHFQFGEAADGFGVLSGGTGTNVVDYSLLSRTVLIDLGRLEAFGMTSFKGIVSWIGGGGPRSKSKLIGPNTTTTWQLFGINEGLVGKTAFSNFHSLHAGTGRNTFRVNPDFIRLDGTLYGNDSDSTLVGPGVDTIWELTDIRGGNLAGILDFQGMTGLTGGDGDDLFRVLDGAADFAKIQGGRGRNILDFSEFVDPVDIDLTANQATATGSFSGIQEFVGHGASSQVWGPNRGNTWNITGPDAVTLGKLKFVDLGSLVGGSADDLFRFVDGAVLSGSVNGGAGTNTLDFGLYTTPVTVELWSGFASPVQQSIMAIQNVYGGSGDDYLVGDHQDNILVGNGGNDFLQGMSGNNVLLGGAGNDILIGGPGRDLLVGGTGYDWLYGGGGEDILIGGLLTYYTESTRTVRQNAFAAIMAEWGRVDRGFAERQASLRGEDSEGLNGSYFLTPSTVRDDKAADELFGEEEENWLFEFPLDIRHD